MNKYTLRNLLLIISFVACILLSAGLWHMNTELTHLQHQVTLIQPRNLLTCQDLKTLAPNMNVSFAPYHCITW